jgi:predicted NodU family carbamoyl transferase
MTAILWINGYHGGASVVLMGDGQLVLAVEEESFNRI